MKKLRGILSCLSYVLVILTFAMPLTANIVVVKAAESYTTSFETSLDGFAKHGNVKVSITDEIKAHTGEKCLKTVREDTEAWAGPSIEIIGTKLNAEYEISAWGKLPSDAEPVNFLMKMYVIDPAASTPKKYVPIDTVMLYPDKWVEFKGTYKSLNTGNLSSPEMLYFETMADGKGVNIYLDDVTIKPLGDAPVVKPKSAGADSTKPNTNKPADNTNKPIDNTNKPTDNTNTNNNPTEPKDSAKTNSDEIKVSIDGKMLTFEDMKPIIQNDRTLVPMRKIFESLNAQISWNDETQTVTATKDYKTIILIIGEKVAKVNGQSITLDVPAIVMNDRTMVPVRFIAESLGTNVTWDDVTKTVVIKSK